jgi:hypothetical protein
MAHAPTFFVGDKTRAFQDAQVLVNCGQGYTERPGKLADGRFTPRQISQDAAARGIA